jgi:biopolymer transport protein ExbB
MFIATAAAAATKAAGAVQKKFGLYEALFPDGEPAYISIAIFASMIIMSAASWYIILTKAFEQSKVLKQSSDGVSKFWSSPSLKDGVNKLEKNTAFRQIVDDGMRAEEEHGRLVDPQDQHEWMHTSLRRSQDAVNSRLGNGLAFLATVGSTSPFVGLLGTVIGIYNALIKIAIEGDASIDKVAGPVGEALIMTAIGLIVAVPAVMGYNWLQRRNKLIAERLGKFSDDLHGSMMSNGAIRPASVKAVAAAPAKAAAPIKA